MRFPIYITVLLAATALMFLEFSYNLHAQEDNKYSQARYYFVGTVGSGNNVQMELMIDSEDVSGSYYYDKKGVPLTLSGTYEPKNSTIKLHEKGEKGLISGTFNGKIKSEGSDYAKTIEGEWSKPGGDKTLPFKLTKVADFVSTRVSVGKKIESSLLYPKFLSKDPALNMINEELKKSMKAQQDKFVSESKEFFSTGDSAGVWSEDRSYSISYYSQDLISLAGEVYSYTGGAHGNTSYLSSNYVIKDSKASPIKLSDLFKPGSNYIKALSAYCMNDLLVKGAGWIVSGEIKSFSDKDLSTFAISPEGLKFAFAPYAVGPYVEGSYFVIVPFRELKRIINPEGPLSQLVDSGSN